MTNTKKPEEDIIATAGTEPEDISDEALEDVDGGYFQIKMTNFSSKTFTGVNADTIYAGSDAETITAFGTNDLVGGSDIGKVGALRKRPTR